MRHLYSVLILLVRPVALAVVLWKGLRERRYWTGLGERFGFGPASRAAPSLWVHAVSLGEVNAAAPLIRALRSRHPAMPLVLTTATITGHARAQVLFGATVSVRFVPYDTAGSMRRFLSRTQPGLVLIMETELWPNLFAQCRRRDIPVVLASARLSPRSVARYRRFGSLFRDVFSGNTHVAAQSAEDAERFVTLGASRERTQVIGNVKFDMTVDAAAGERGHALRAAEWGTRPVWIAGSTHAGEEEQLLAAQNEFEAQCRGGLLVLVPRHPQRFDGVAGLLERRGIRFQRRSAGGLVRPGTQVLLVDSVGELAALYAAADVAFVGGSLVPVGGHNLLEPAALGVPVIMGPHQFNGREIAQLLLRAGGARQVKDAPELAAVLRELCADPELRRRMGAAGRLAVEQNRGSVARLVEFADTILRQAGVIP